MKLNENFIIHNTESSSMLVGIGTNKDSFRGIINLNETAAIIVSKIDEGKTKEQIIAYLIDLYSADKDRVEKGYNSIVSRLDELNAIDY